MGCALSRALVDGAPVDAGPVTAAGSLATSTATNKMTESKAERNNGSSGTASMQEPTAQLPLATPSPSETDKLEKRLEPSKLSDIRQQTASKSPLLPLAQQLDPRGCSQGSSPSQLRTLNGGSKANHVGQLSTSKISDHEFGGGARKSEKGSMGARRSLDEMDLPDPNQLQREADTDKKRSHSIGSEYGSIRFTEWVTAKDSRRKQGRIAVSSESELELRTKLSQLPTFNSVLKKEAEFVLNVIRTHFLFSKMSTEQLLCTVQYMERLALQRGDQLVKQGEANARHFYIIYTGGMDVTVVKEGEKTPIVVAHLVGEPVTAIRPAAFAYEMQMPRPNRPCPTSVACRELQRALARWRFYIILSGPRPSPRPSNPTSSVYPARRTS